MRRVSVVGSSGSGKTTVSRALAAGLGLPHFELDSIFHQANWVPLEIPEFRAEIERVSSSDSWVIDGNYRRFGVQEIVWPRADTVIWLDPPRRSVMRRLVVRTVRRAITREELWNGNREPLTNFYSRDPERNVIVWAWTRFEPQRTEYATMLAEDTWSHLVVHRLRTVREIDSFLTAIGGKPEH